ncbi:hypothetical protein SAMN02910298_01991 [Pseudobutyrivibrio sp. YE44]|uniref:WG repeat-containing protein n=1 Tax=Pseudobutyrivibrio sp. YE44 TaxID=1520802 RepID=UPI0008872222|nr:WG repeat-containing protein [Pseudobutyrivibrio sp. YE44]SDB40529.1 hypothetical protein SAMN02910298_01991 [Pseudobutyrivibrio sp. YE44]
MNITRKIEELKKMDTKKALLLFTYVNFINVMLHMAGFYATYISVGLEYFIYYIKISSMLLVYWSMPREGLYVNRRIKNSFKVMIGLDVMEVCIYFMHGSATYLKVVLAASFIIKFVLEYCIYENLVYVHYSFYDKIRSNDGIGKYISFNTKWILIYLAIIVTFFLTYIGRKPFLWIVLMFLLASRLYYSVKIVKDCYDDIRFRIIERSGFYNTDAKEKGIYADKILNSKKTKWTIGIAAIFVLIMANIYTSFDICLLVDSEGKKLTEQTSAHAFSCKTDDVYIYTLRNLFPVWTGFYNEKYGIVNIKTGENTGAIYDKYPSFDDVGIAYDGKRHFIDLNGDKVCKIPWFITRRISERQRFLTGLAEVINDAYRDYYDYKDIDFLEYRGVKFEKDFYDERTYQNRYFDSEVYDSLYYYDCFTYFNCKDICEFETDLGDMYGLINKKGEIIAEPQYSEIYTDANYEVSECRGKQYDLIAGDGKKLCAWGSLGGDRGIVYADGQIIDLEGNIWNYYFDDKTKNQKCLRIRRNEKIIFDSTLYTDYCAVYSKDYKLINLIAKKNDSDYSVLIDLNGKQVIPGEYNWLKVYDDGSVVGVTKDNTVVAADLNGNMIDTGYTYKRYDVIRQIIHVCDESGTVPKYNLMNIKGQILCEKWFDVKLTSDDNYTYYGKDLTDNSVTWFRYCPETMSMKVLGTAKGYADYDDWDYCRVTYRAALNIVEPEEEPDKLAEKYKWIYQYDSCDAPFDRLGTNVYCVSKEDLRKKYNYWR